MNDRAVGLLEQYDCEVLKTRKGRGAILCETDKGDMIFKEYPGNLEKARLQDRLLSQIHEKGEVRVETLIPTKEGQLLVKDHEEKAYILKTYFDGRECNIFDKAECVEAVRLLARLHGSMQLETEEGGSFYAPEKEYEKHNRELRKVKRYLRDKGQKTWFEICLQQSLDYFLEQAERVTQEWKQYSLLTPGQPESRRFCHGDFQYHNIIRLENDWYIVNFEKIIRDNPVRDLYLFMRKLLEKSDWSVALGRELLEVYEERMPLSAYSRIDLYYRLAYPEKFWKIVNFYFNARKAWMPERNLEKLQKLLDQEEEKQHFLDEIFRKVR